MGCAWNYRTDSFTQIPVRDNLELLDKWMEKMMESAASAYMPKLESIAEERRAELSTMKSRIRSNPEEVERWFDQQIEKLNGMNVADMLNMVR